MQWTDIDDILNKPDVFHEMSFSLGIGEQWTFRPCENVLVWSFSDCVVFPVVDTFVKANQILWIDFWSLDGKPHDLFQWSFCSTTRDLFVEFRLGVVLSPSKSTCPYLFLWCWWWWSCQHDFLSFISFVVVENLTKKTQQILDTYNSWLQWCMSFGIHLGTQGSLEAHTPRSQRGMLC